MMRVGCSAKGLRRIKNRKFIIQQTRINETGLIKARSCWHCFGVMERAWMEPMEEE
jgi:hypothetical protein